MKTRSLKVVLALLMLLLVLLACDDDPALKTAPSEQTSTPSRAGSVFDSGRTAYGFFPSPPRPTTNSVVRTLQGMADHADVVLFQEPIPWEDFIDASGGESQKIEEMWEVVAYIEALGMEPIFIVDPLNGLNRREFQGLPPALAGSDFSTPEVRAAFKNFALRLAREFQPRYLGLASEINTYLDAYPADAENYRSLYRETYAAVKEEFPDTQVFVTFQWDDLNRLDGDGTPYEVKWDQVEAFEPYLDVWAISSYPYFFFETPGDVPEDYYTPLLDRTEKPLAVAESGWTSESVESWRGSPAYQSDYLSLLDGQIGARLDFWINLIYADLEWKSYRGVLREEGSADDLGTLSYFTYLGLVEADGAPKPALEKWDELRAREP
jgi:hypothetical protein